MVDWVLQIEPFSQQIVKRGVNNSSWGRRSGVGGPARAANSFSMGEIQP